MSLLTLAASSFALAYYFGQARIFLAPRTRLDKRWEKKAKAIAEAMPAKDERTWKDWGLARWAVWLAFWRSMLKCRKCWSQWGSWISLSVSDGPFWGWSREDLILSIAAAGLAILAYEMTLLGKKP